MEMVVIKRNGLEERFDPRNIRVAVQKAMKEVNGDVSFEIQEEVVNSVEAKALMKESKITVEEIQDIIEDRLIELGEIEVAKAFIRYRHERTMKRKARWEMDDLQKDILYKKYIFENEGFDGFISRVGYGDSKVQKLIREKKFIPAGRILAGRRLYEHGKKVTYSNCFVITPPEDNIESIFDTAKKMARTYSYGGGCGTSLGNLRPRFSKVNNSAKETTGAVSFMDLYSMTTGLIGQQGRRGALMISLPVDHPDIVEFVSVKTDLSKVTFANISIMVSDEFMKTVKDRGVWEMTFEVKDTGEVIKRHVDAFDLFERIASVNRDYGEPGMLFWDRVKEYHLNSENPDFEYASTNPCGEKPLPSGGSCLLGSMNVDAYVVDGKFQFREFADDVRTCTAYLDDVLEEGIALLPLGEQRESVSNYRQIGLGIMGLSDAFIHMEYKYGDEESLILSEEIAKLMINNALQESAIRAKELGTYPLYNREAVLKSKFLKEVATEETYKLVAMYGLRNAELLSIAPTGSISTMIGVSGGIEPIFNISYTRESKSLGDNGSTFYKVFTPIAKEYMDEHGLTKEEELPDFFVTSGKLNYKKRIDMQSVWQKYIDAGISSTVNLPKGTSSGNIQNLYMYAWEKGLKGITVFVDGCKRLGILTNNDDSTGSDEPESEVKETEYKVNLNYADDKFSKCPECGEPIEVITNGCAICMNCGASPC